MTFDQYSFLRPTQAEPFGSSGDGSSGFQRDRVVAEGLSGLIVALTTGLERAHRLGPSPSHGWGTW